MDLYDRRDDAADDRHAAGMGQFVKFTQEYPDIAEWHGRRLDCMRVPDPAVRINGEPLDVETLVDARYAIKCLYKRFAVKRAIRDMDREDARQYVQNGLEKAVDFHANKHADILTTYLNHVKRGGFEHLDADSQWIVETVYRVALEPGDWGGPNVKIAHDLMVDLIEAGSGPLLSYSTVSRLYRTHEVRACLTITKGYLNASNERRATRYSIPVHTSGFGAAPPVLLSQPGNPQSVPDRDSAIPTRHSLGASDGLPALDIATGGHGCIQDQSVELWQEALDAPRPLRISEPLTFAVPRLTRRQVTAFWRYTVDGVSPSRARRRGGEHQVALDKWISREVTKHIAADTLGFGPSPGFDAAMQLT